MPDMAAIHSKMNNLAIKLTFKTLKCSEKFTKESLLYKLWDNLGKGTQKGWTSERNIL